MNLLLKHCRSFVFILGLLLTGCALSPTVSPPKLQNGTAQHPIEISGVMQQDLRLGGVIRLSGDLLIPKGRNLQVEPGSRILVVGTDSTKIDPEFLDKGTEILVKGRIHLAGEKMAPVTLSLDEETPAGENWAGIELVAAEEAVFRFVDIIGAETGILSLDSSPQLEEVNILGSRYGLLLQGTGRLDYAGGRISGGDAGLLCFDQSVLNLNQLQIIDNLEEGLYLAVGCTLQQQGLLIERNDLGAVASAESRELLAPTLRANRVNFKPLAQEGSLQ